MDDYVAKPVKPADLERVLSGATAATTSEAESARAAQAEGAPAPLDAVQLAVLRTLDGGDGEFLATLVDTYLSSAPRCLARLREAVDRGDAAALEREAHRFKGESATVGATVLADMCEELGRLGDQPGSGATEAVEAVERMEAELARVRQALPTLVGPRPPTSA
jgi:HPt (histidine-containing phosphotransfer) domain-containing protein